MTLPVTHIDVTVESSGCIVCSPDPVRVRTTDTVLSFKLRTPGFAFRDQNAIVVANPGPDFPNPSRTVKPTRATLVDLDKENASYSYSVYVVDQSTGKVITGDPTIENVPE